MRHGALGFGSRGGGSCVFVRNGAFGRSRSFRGVRGLKVCRRSRSDTAAFRNRECGDKKAAPRFDLEIALVEQGRVGAADGRET